MFTKKQTNILKGIAVLLLLIHHSWAPLKTETMPVYGEAIKTMTSMGKLSVAIFAILSGYGMFKSAEKKDRSVWEGVLAHILKVYTVFWLTGGLLAALVSASNGGLSVLYGRMPVYHLLLDLLALSHIARTPMLANSWWYVTAALLYYCFFPFLYGGIAKLKKGNYILWLLSAMWLMLHPGTNTILVYGIFFVMGMILAERDLPSRLLALCDRYFVADLLLFPLIGGLAGSLYVRQTFLSGLKAEYYLDWLPALFVILITAILTASIPDRFPGPLELTGSLSFEIFLIHGAFIKYAPHLVYPDDICGLVLLRLYGLSLAGALVIRLVTRLGRLERLPAFLAGSRAGRRFLGPALALLIVCMTAPGMIANLGIGEIELYPRQAVMEVGDWYAPVYTKTTFLWDFAVPKYTSSNPSIAYMEDGVIYAQSPGKAKFTVSTAGGTFGSIQVIVKDPEEAP